MRRPRKKSKRGLRRANDGKKRMRGGRDPGESYVENDRTRLVESRQKKYRRSTEITRILAVTTVGRTMGKGGKKGERGSGNGRKKGRAGQSEGRNYP